MNGTNMKNILWMAAGMAIAGMLMVVNGLLRGEIKQGKVIVTEEVAPAGKDMEWPSCFTNVTKLAGWKAFDRFITEFKTELDKKEKSVKDDILSIVCPDTTEEADPEWLMIYYRDSQNAVRNAKGIGNGSSMYENVREAILNDVAELYQWKMFLFGLKRAKGGERIILLDDQKKWMAWRKEHTQLICEAAGEGTGRTGFENSALHELEEDRLYELYYFDEDCPDIYCNMKFSIYRDLKFASVRFKGKDVPLNHGRLYFEKDGKKVVGRIINPAFCQRVVSEGNIYKFAVLEPDYILDVGPNSGTYSWACIWKNGKNTANYRLPIEKKVRHLTLFSEEREKESGIQAISVSNTVVSIIPSITGTPVAIDIKAANSECID
jgi:hypothetical protein